MDLMKIIWNGGNVEITINLFFSLILILILILLYYKPIKKEHFKNKEYEIDEATMGIGNNTIKIKPNYEDKQIAYKL